MNTEDSFEKES